MKLHVNWLLSLLSLTNLFIILNLNPLWNSMQSLIHMFYYGYFLKYIAWGRILLMRKNTCWYKCIQHWAKSGVFLLFHSLSLVYVILHCFNANRCFRIYIRTTQNSIITKLLCLSSDKELNITRNVAIGD